MNNLEFINQNIFECENRIEHLEIKIIEDKKYPSLVKSHKECIEELKPILKHLEQIKNILEAWKELNELFIIKPYYQDKENNKYPAIMIQHKIEKDFEYVRRGCKQKSFDTIIKALENNSETK